jgi:CubicO group peptidase (beta-lactamase class C family)
MEATGIEQPLNALRETGEFSGVVSVLASGKPAVSEAYGMANRSDAVPNSIDTRFQLASGCKVFTSVAVCQLVERGLLSFDTPLRDCLDIEFPHFDSSITVHHLLTHTSGVPDYFDEKGGEGYESLWKDRPMYGIRRPADFLPLFRNERMRFAPGERFSYNNAGFILLGLIVEQLSEMEFPRYVETHVLARSGMTDSGYFFLDRLPERTALSYVEDPENGAWRTNTYSVPIIGGPDGGAFATARDIGRFWRALFGNRLLGEGPTRDLLEPRVTTAGEPPSTQYGYGVWIIQKDDSTTAHYICGSDPGVSFLSVAHDRGQVVITILANTNRKVWSIHDNIVRTLGDR